VCVFVCVCVCAHIVFELTETDEPRDTVSNKGYDFNA